MVEYVSAETSFGQMKVKGSLFFFSKVLVVSHAHRVDPSF